MAENWSDEELAAAFNAYEQMAQLEASKKPYSKRKYYQVLAAQFGRTEKSFEYRMQNISSVLHERGLNWIPGLKPAGNVGTHVKQRIETLLNNTQTEITSPKLSAYKTKLPAMREWLIEVARSKGKVFYSEMMKVFDVDRFSLRHAMDYLGHQSDNRDEPIITALIVSKSTNSCSAGLFKEFNVEDDETERQRLYEYWANNSTTHTALPDLPGNDLKTKALRFAIVASRPDQAAFRREVFEACGGKCVISGCDIDKVLDAAHKHGRDWRVGHNKASDGYLLRKDLHALYDKKLLSIGEDGIVILAEEAVAHYQEFAGNKIT